jgi:hypothetical protein
LTNGLESIAQTFDFNSQPMSFVIGEFLSTQIGFERILEATKPFFKVERVRIFNFSQGLLKLTPDSPLPTMAKVFSKPFLGGLSLDFEKTSVFGG